MELIDADVIEAFGVIANKSDMSIFDRHLHFDGLDPVFVHCITDIDHEVFDAGLEEI